jgi:hypothetical protein
MAEDLYCSRGDVNDWLPSGELVGKSSLVASAVASTDVLTLDGHGLETGDAVKVRAIEGGSLPAPLAPATLYYAIRLTNAEFKLATSPSNATAGTAIDLTTSGVEMVLSREPKYDAAIEFWSRWADGFLPAHAVPLGRTEPVHPLVKVLVAKLAAYDLMGIEGKDSARALAAKTDAQKALERLELGIPLRGAPAPAPTNLAVKALTANTIGYGRGVLP